MRAVGRLSTTPAGPTTTKQALLLSSSSSFSSSSGSSGRGRGRGFSPPFISQPPGKVGRTDPDASAESDPLFPPGVGHGRGKPIPPTPVINSFSSWISPTNPSAGRGGSLPSVSFPHPQQPATDPPSKKPIFFRRDDDDSEPALNFGTIKEGILPRNLQSGLPGAGRGMPAKPSDSDTRVREENRHLRQRPQATGPTRGGLQPGSPSPPRPSRREVGDRAVMRPEDGGRGRGGRWRGRGGRGMRDFRGRGGRGGARRFVVAEIDDAGTGLYLGDNADGDKLVQRLGDENMNKLIEGFEEMSSSVLPSPMDEKYLDAVDTNFLIEFEPEYLMEEFGTNPDIDEKPPIPLRDALEKMKPFLMAYEGIQSQEEWEEIMKDTMEKVPYLKQIIDMYAGPDRVTAKEQQEELERIAKTLPDNIPSSVKRFTDRALLSLQSNPGWGFDKKYQFMDKLVRDVSQQYK
ncbi:uncharacterized protein LOC131221140 [Magnolia sinica]|uniref:uncharacterized protein LOC131221140 n=1 Tax=Magnolia sinica TaxID=86752 RepID=UPI00265A1909|nr:uncharacterized protein LOC131221140 [Magnolia sinica]